MSIPIENSLYDQLGKLFGRENITLSEEKDKSSRNINAFPIKKENEIIGWLELNDKLSLDDYHTKLIELLIEKHEVLNTDFSNDTEQLMWREAIEQDVAIWRDKWEALHSSVEKTFVNVYFQLPYAKTDENELISSVKELLLAATENKSYFLQLENGLYVWIIRLTSDEKKDMVKIVEEVLHTLTAELLLELKVFLGELYEMPMQLKEIIKDEGEYYILAQQYSLSREVVTFNDIIPYLFVNSVRNDEINHITEKLLGTIKEDEELLHTLKVYMKENLNVSEAAKKLYIHRNSLQYRLDKFSEKTGIDIRDFENAVNVYLLILALGKLNNN
ncbi:hypothetical protein CIB95_13115 [Lottiidibacillus patelloidae]|uniref:PucR C-terminal helix-turn-helix domain-containing protein n=1 Tax=Lottiidibacillus patelloidae TaxID=2670334 RepID=A0A263BS03_9BACI|nr:helix-turn-helix domain-containing protein [Lottiidibacillus patelloidae]OZM56348.1 hypothetical protein CIB95_13115 [Lottiidibacillus patelloidae]